MKTSVSSFIKGFIPSFMLLSVLVGSSCTREVSNSTGWNVNDPRNGGFEVQPQLEQETGPGLILIEGGRFTMGSIEQDVMYTWNNVPRTMSVSSFYMWWK